MGRGKRQAVLRNPAQGAIIPLGDGDSQSRAPAAVQAALAKDASESLKPTIADPPTKGTFTHSLAIDKKALARNGGDLFDASVDEALALHSEAAEVTKVNGGDDYYEIMVVDNDDELIVAYICTPA